MPDRVVLLRPTIQVDAATVTPHPAFIDFQNGAVRVQQDPTDAGVVQVRVGYGLNTDVTLGTETTAVGNGNNVTVTAGNGVTLGQGGTATLQGGTGVGNAPGGPAQILGGAGGTGGVQGAGGNVLLDPGDAGAASGGAGGNLILRAGAADGAGTAGVVRIDDQGAAMSVLPTTTNLVQFGSAALAFAQMRCNILLPGLATALQIQRQDGTAWATTSTGTAETNININTRFLDNIETIWGTSNDSFMGWETTQATANSLMLAIGVGTAAQGGNFILTTTTNFSSDHGYAVATNPTLYIASATTPASNYISFSHNATNANIKTGAGSIVLQTAAGSRWVFDNAGNIIPASGVGTQSLGSSAVPLLNAWVRNVQPDAAANLTLTRPGGAQVWATITSSVTTLTGTQVASNNDIAYSTASEARIRWSSAQTNNAMMIGIGVNSASRGGAVIITEASAVTTDHGYVVSANPILYIASATTPASNWVSLTHNATDAVLTVGAGDLEISATQVRAPSGSNLVIARGAGTPWATISSASSVAIGVATVFEDAIVAVFGTGQDASLAWATGQANDALMLATAVGSAAQSGNILIVNAAHRLSDFDRAVATNPTVYIFSATDPDTANDEWISIKHDGTDGVIDVGSGAVSIAPTSGITKFRGVDYTWPVADGAGVLTSDGAGNLSWV